MKVKIQSDEWYPVLYLDERFGDEVNVPRETVKRWKRILADFDTMQDEMCAALERQPPPDSAVSSICKIG